MANKKRRQLEFIDQHAIGLAISASLILIVMGVFAVRVVSGFGKTPRWWSQIEATRTDHTALVEQGNRLENAITTQLTQVRDPADSQWSVAIDVQQVNAWLETRLIQTVQTHQGQDAWPREIQQVRVEIMNDQLVIGMRLVHTTGALILWAKGELELDQNSDLWITISNAHLGTTRVPTGVLNRLASEQLSQSSYRLGEGKINLGDGRTANLLALRIKGGRLELVMDTRFVND